MPASLRAFGALCAALAGLAPFSTTAQTVEEFYKSRTVEIYVGGGAGNIYDQWARLIARGLQRRLPGAPNIVVRNMPGGGDIVVTNYLYNVAPRDGGVIAIVSRNMPTQEALGVASVRFKMAEFNYLGSPEFTQRVCLSYHKSPVQKAEDLFTREMPVGGVGGGSAVSTTPVLLGKLFGMKFKLIDGYQNGPQVALAMERGEVEGVCETLAATEAAHPGSIASGKVTVLFNLDKGPLPAGIKAPSVHQFIKTDDQRQILEFYNSSVELGRPVFTTPGVPADRLAALRTAWEGMMADPEFRAEVQKAGYAVNPISAEVVAQRVRGILSAPKDTIDKTIALVGSLGG